MMQATSQSLDVKNLCSRKLWEILVYNEDLPLSAQQKLKIEAELLERQHYLEELNIRHRDDYLD